MQRNASAFPKKAAIIFEDETLSWSELWQKVESASAQLEEHVVSKKQEVVALLITNSSEFVVIYLAILHLGHIAFPLDPAYKKLELDAIIDEISPKALIVGKNYLQSVSHQEATTIRAEDLIKTGGKPKSVLRLPIDKQIVSLTFTSGTTGTPKVVPTTDANQIWTVETCSRVWDWTEKDSLLVSIPLSHWYGLVMGICAALYHGNSLYLIDQRFDAQKTLKILASGKVTIYQHISVLYLKLLEAEGDYDLSNVRLCISGAAPLPPEVWRQFKKRFGIEILETYGSSEAGRIAANRLGDKPMLGSPGKVLPGVDMKLSSEGEVMVKSGGVFPGYFNNPSATSEAFTKDGYFKTGDIGEINGDYLVLKGRVAERIRRFGYTISPRDIEWALHQHPKVRDIYVMGRQRRGDPNDELIYFVVGNIDDDEINDYCKQNLIFTWRPDRIVHMPNLPRTKSGKPRVAEFKQLVAENLN